MKFMRLIDGQREKRCELSQCEVSGFHLYMSEAEVYERAKELGIYPLQQDWLYGRIRSQLSSEFSSRKDGVKLKLKLHLKKRDPNDEESLALNFVEFSAELDAEAISRTLDMSDIKYALLTRFGPPNEKSAINTAVLTWGPSETNQERCVGPNLKVSVGGTRAFSRNSGITVTLKDCDFSSAMVPEHKRKSLPKLEEYPLTEKELRKIPF